MYWYGSIPRPTRKEEAVLVRLAGEGDAEARGHLLLSIMPYIRKVALRLSKGKKELYEDLVGDMSLMVLERLASGLDPSLARITTYFFGFLKEYAGSRLLAYKTLVAERRRVQMVLQRYLFARREFRKLYRRFPSFLEIAEYLKISPKDARNLAGILKEWVSIDTTGFVTVSGHKNRRYRVMGISTKEDDPFELVSVRTQREAIDSLLCRLDSGRQIQVLERYFGLDGQKGQSMSVIARSYACSRQTISGSLHRALRRLRHPSRSKFLKSYYYD